MRRAEADEAPVAAPQSVEAEEGSWVAPSVTHPEFSKPKVKERRLWSYIGLFGLAALI